MSPPGGGARYALLFLADEWEWDGEVDAPSLEAAKASAREALENLVRSESPTIACVTLLHDGRKLGVWDWVGGQANWSPL